MPPFQQISGRILGIVAWFVCCPTVKDCHLVLFILFQISTKWMLILLQLHLSSLQRHSEVGCVNPCCHSSVCLVAVHRSHSVLGASKGLWILFEKKPSRWDIPGEQKRSLLVSPIVTSFALQVYLTRRVSFLFLHWWLVTVTTSMS